LNFPSKFSEHNQPQQLLDILSSGKDSRCFVAR
jgi:hypothetical protein